MVLSNRYVYSVYLDFMFAHSSGSLSTPFCVITEPTLSTFSSTSIIFHHMIFHCTIVCAFIVPTNSSVYLDVNHTCSRSSVSSSTPSCVITEVIIVLHYFHLSVQPPSMSYHIDHILSFHYMSIHVINLALFKYYICLPYY